jgi:hypothetical protein
MFIVTYLCVNLDYNFVVVLLLKELFIVNFLFDFHLMAHSRTNVVFSCTSKI